jgi:hypothetical protein
MTPNRPDLSVVLLCYRGEDSIPPYVEELKVCLNELRVNWEIILAGNYLEGADDRTPEIV